MKERIRIKCGRRAGWAPIRVGDSYETVGIYFRHHFGQEGEDGTLCSLVKFNGESPLPKVLATGLAFLSRKDKYDGNKGERESFARAIALLPDAEREKLWKWVIDKKIIRLGA